MTVWPITGSRKFAQRLEPLGEAHPEDLQTMVPVKTEPFDANDIFSDEVN